MPRHQVIPGGKREEAARGAFVKSASKAARQSPKIRISVKWHQARPASSDLFGRCRVRILTFTTLYPNLLQPQHGIFVETRLRKLVASGAVSARVVAPCPWFPFASARFGRYAVFARMPSEETRYGLRVKHPRYPVFPRLGMSVAPLALYAAVLPFLRRQIRDGHDFDLIDAHYFYPDGVAAVLLGRALDRPVVVTARGDDLDLISTYAVPRRWIQWAAQRAAGLITVSNGLKRRLEALGTAPHRVHMLRNGVDLA